jgi:hypothetical protein
MRVSVQGAQKNMGRKPAAIVLTNNSRREIVSEQRIDRGFPILELGWFNLDPAEPGHFLRKTDSSETVPRRFGYELQDLSRFALGIQRPWLVPLVSGPKLERPAANFCSDLDSIAFHSVSEIVHGLIVGHIDATFAIGKAGLNKWSDRSELFVGVLFVIEAKMTARWKLIDAFCQFGRHNSFSNEMGLLELEHDQDTLIWMKNLSRGVKPSFSGKEGSGT